MNANEGGKPAGVASSGTEECILLSKGPRLYFKPEGKRSKTPLPSKTLDRATILERKFFGRKGTPWVRIKFKGQSGWLPEALTTSLPNVTVDALKTIGNEPVDRFHGIPHSYEPPDLTSTYQGYEEGRAYKLRREAAGALEKMVAAARRDGMTLKVFSAYRSYERQRAVYLNKLARSGWDQTEVSKPGHSEHQLGTAVDLTDGNEKTLLQPAFGDSPAGKWLLDHAPQFGFAISYAKANAAKTGYSYEPWHYRYYGIKIAGKKHREALGK